MPLLSQAKKKMANQLGSAAMHADAKQTDFCVYLSAILLVGLLLKPGRRWRWADPTAALIMVSLIANEGGGNERQDLLRLAWMNLKAGN
jgi:divalent metal cation (Fe/Co/Zn/Cd) transporter